MQLTDDAHRVSNVRQRRIHVREPALHLGQRFAQEPNAKRSELGLLLVERLTAESGKGFVAPEPHAVAANRPRSDRPPTSRLAIAVGRGVDKDRRDALAVDVAHVSAAE